MKNTLQWKIPGETFEDGSHFRDWVKVEESGVWHWQYDTHELSFDIYRHDDQYWKLYRMRLVPEGSTDYSYHFGGQACRMVLVEYLSPAKSPHSHRLMRVGDREWVRTYEFDSSAHRVVEAGKPDPSYGAPYGKTRDVV
ncbi:MAG: hypothetical protein AAGF92_22715 [Myxococcota bacterium]